MDSYPIWCHRVLDKLHACSGGQFFHPKSGRTKRVLIPALERLQLQSWERQCLLCLHHSTGNSLIDFHVGVTSNTIMAYIKHGCGNSVAHPSLVQEPVLMLLQLSILVSVKDTIVCVAILPSTEGHPSGAGTGPRVRRCQPAVAQIQRSRVGSQFCSGSDFWQWRGCRPGPAWTTPCAEARKSRWANQWIGFVGTQSANQNIRSY